MTYILVANEVLGMFSGSAVLLSALLLYLVDFFALIKGRFRLGYASMIVAVLLSLFAASSFSYFFVSDNFAVKAVYEQSSRSLPPLLKLSASWTGAGGSLLLWLAMMTVAMLSFRIGKRDPMNGQQRVASIVMSLFTMAVLALAFMTNPFDQLGVRIPDGMGQNPSLQTSWSMIHPPAVFAAYTTLLFSYSILVSRRWTSSGEPCAPDRMLWASWTLLSLAISFGAAWAYETSGWGGYWAWDPIETSALIPWLILSALLFTEPLRVGRDYRLVVTTFSVSTLIFTVYIARNAAAPGLHGYGAFIGGTFILLFAFVPVLVSLVAVRRSPSYDLRVDERSCRPAALAFWSLILLASANLILLFYLSFASLLGTVARPDPQLHNYASFPMLIVFLTAVIVRCIKNRPTTWKMLLSFGFLLVLGLAFALFRYPTENALANIGLSFVFGLVSTTAYCILKGAVRRPRPVRPYSNLGCVAFLGIGVLLVGVFISSSMQVSATETLRAGDSFNAVGLELSIVRIAIFPSDRQVFFPPYGILPESIDTRVIYTSSDEPSASRTMLLRYYPVFDRFVATPSIQRSLMEDIYIVASATTTVRQATVSTLENKNATMPTDIKITVKRIPGVSLVWLGVTILVIGSLPLVLSRHGYWRKDG